MVTKISTKLSEEGINFLKNLRRNRIKTNTDKEGLSYWKLLEIINKYFKINNESYLMLIKIEGDKK